MCGEYIDIIPSNIPQMKIAVRQWTARFHILRKPEECWCLLRNLSLGLFGKNSRTFQNFSGLFLNSRYFHDFPRLVGPWVSKVFDLRALV